VHSRIRIDETFGPPSVVLLGGTRRGFVRRTLLMTRNKDFKKLVRTRMRKTGESYTTSRLQLLRKSGGAESAPSRRATGARQTPVAAPVVDVSKAPMADATILAKTGKTWSEWVAVLDAAGAERMPHRDIAAYVNELGIDGWWSQTVTVGYERIRGLRDVGQRRGGGYEVNKSKTYAVPLAKLYRAFADTRTRNRWLPGVALTIRTATKDKSMRVTWEDGSDLQLWFSPKNPGRSSVAVQHGKLASRDDADQVRGFWAERLNALGVVLGAAAPARRTTSGKKRV
jgi:hypothetical protein